MKGKIFCPMAQQDCQEDRCILWSPFPAINPQTGKAVINAKTGEVEIVGYGCTAYGKIIRSKEAVQ